MKYLGLSAFGMVVCSSWLLPSGRIIHINIENNKQLKMLLNKYGEMK